MPQTKFQEAVFGVMMASVMVYGMELYNLSLAKGGLQAGFFPEALGGIPLMGAIVLLLEGLIAGPAAKKLAFRFFSPERDNPLLLTLLISAFTIWMMCPMMSCVATLLFKHPKGNFLPLWLQTVACNFPMAFFWQIFFAGPLVRFLFRRLFPEKREPVSVSSL